MRFHHNQFGQDSQPGVIALVSLHSIAHGLNTAPKIILPLYNNYEQYQPRGHHTLNTNTERHTTHPQEQRD